MRAVPNPPCLVPSKCLHLDPSGWVEPKELSVRLLEKKGA